MRIGKEIKKVKSPERRAVKAKPCEMPAFVPQEAPKEPAKVESFVVNWRMFCGIDWAKDANPIHYTGS